MTKNLFAAAAVITLLIGGCTLRSSGSGGNASPDQVYTAAPSIDQVRSMFGSSSWWPGTPTFGVRPLDLESTPQSVRFTITQRYVRLGSGDSIHVDYLVYASTSTATTFMNNIQSSLSGNVATTPKAGDQVLYTGQKQPTVTALYETDAIVRLGQIVAVAAVKQGSGFVDHNQLGRLANLLVSRLKDALANKLHPTLLARGDQQLLPPAGTDVTLLGIAKLPVQVAADMLDAASPENFTTSFKELGASDFVFGDYALNADLHMEVRAAVFTFSSSSAGATWIDAFIGKTNLSASGVFLQYIDAIKQYIGVFVAGSHGAILMCKSTLETEAASRACETPMVRVIDAWQVSLNNVR